MSNGDRIGTLNTTTISSSVRGPGARVFHWVIDSTDLAILVIGLGMLVAYLGAAVVFPKPGGRVVFGDASHHYVQLRSMVFDRDLDFRNDYMRLYGLQSEEPGTEWIFTDLTPTGHVRNYMPVGPALLWAPLYLLVAGVQSMFAFAGLAAKPDGFGHALQLVPGVTGVLAATAAAWLSWRLARRWTAPAPAAIGTLAMWLGSSAVYYSLISPSYSHAASMLATSLFFVHWLDGREGPSQAPAWSVRRAVVSGALAGFASLMRWQDALLLGIPIFEAIRAREPWTRRTAEAGAALLGWALVFSPQMAVWRVLYGQALALPQGPSFLQWFAPHPFAVLLSDNHGLFSWTPVVVPGVVGLALFANRHRTWALPLAAIVIAAWYVNAAVADWWAGEAFGGRRFLSLFPLFVLGLATWMDAPKVRARSLVTVGALVGATWLLLLQYEVFMKGHTALAPYPKGAFNFWLARFVVPWRLVSHWLS